MAGAKLAPLARAALQNLEANRQRIDDLNVYPVPDGDTGSNLVLTLRRIVETIESSDAATDAALADEVFHVALRAGKGNSGVIFSQIVRGFAKSLGEAGEVTSTTLAEGFRAGSDAAYRAVAHVGPVEGTIITVIREMAEEAEAVADGVGPEELLDRVVARGEDALERTPQMLEVLARAGVVDAGGAGLVEIVRGVALAANGRELPSAPVLHEELGVDAVHQELSRYRYCTGFVVEGDLLDAEAFEAKLATLGDSLLVVGDDTALKVHVHTDDPGAALSAATSLGVIDEVEIADMYAQTAAREARLGAVVVPVALETGLVVVSQGAGNREVFENAGAAVVEGGQTTNPTVGEIADAIEAAPAEAVIVLPNNSNVLLAAREAVALTEKDARVVPSTSIQAGLVVALERYIASNPIDRNEAEMNDKLAAISTGEVTTASKDAELDGLDIREGSFFGLVNGVAVASGTDLVDVFLEVVTHAMDGRDSLFLVTGENAPDSDVLLEAIASVRPDLEPYVVDGRQPHYPVLVAAE
jgi:DAK2 domain fusion protein YloV